MAGDPLNIVFGNATVDIGGDLGYIKDGITIAKSEEIYRPSGIEGILTSPVARRVSEEYTFTFTLIEPTLSNIRMVWDVTNAIAGAGPPDTLDVGGDSAVVNIRTLTVTGIVPGGVTTRTIKTETAIAMGPGEHKITQFEEAALPATFVTLWNNSDTRLLDFSDA